MLTREPGFLSSIAVMVMSYRCSGRYAEAGHLEALQQERHICRAKRFFD